MATSSLPPPPQLNVNIIAKDWKRFKQIWDNYYIVMKLTKESSEFQIATFLTVAGPDAMEICNGLELSEEEKKSLDVVLRKFAEFALGEENEIFERYNFYTLTKNKDENIESYIASLRTLSSSCNFCACSKECLVRDRIVLGVTSEQLRKRLLREPKLTLKSCIDICKWN